MIEKEQQMEEELLMLNNSEQEIELENSELEQGVYKLMVEYRDY